MILRPRVLLVAIGTGVFWLIALIAPLLALAGWRVGHAPLAWGGGMLTLACLIAYRLFRSHEAGVRRWVADD
ncbi:MAG: hypothetical protein R3E87_15925 [Burkholderiaceae bacterium]